LARDWKNAGSDPPHPNSATVLKRFGSWSRAIEATGLPPRRRRWTQAEIVSVLRASAEREGMAPRSNRWKAQALNADRPLPSCRVIISRFGSWRAALEAADLAD
jgi:hypothetical protein